MILVTGATGNVGGELVRTLLGAGDEVRALTRHAGQSSVPSGVEAVAGDLNRPETLSSAVTGVDGVFLMSGYQDMPGVLAEIRRAGVDRVVLMAGSSVLARNTNNAISRYMIDSEAAVRQSGVRWTILRPYGFMSNALQWVPQLQAGDVVRAPFAGVRIAVVDPFDIAAVAAEALRADGHHGHAYSLTGPESMLPAERLRTLGAVLGRELRFEGQRDSEARAEMSASMPIEYVDAFFSFYVEGTLDESEVLPTVEEVTGRAPRTFEQWALIHAEAFG